MQSGSLYALGLGPGDPELLTLKALRLLRSVPVVAYPAPESGESFARRIVGEWLDQGQREIAIRFPMRPGPPPAGIYRRAAAELAAVLAGGENVAYLCQGDALFYGSFSGLMAYLPEDCRVTIVPGVSSPMACAAAAAMPLVARDEAFTVIPATLPEQQIAHRLAGAEAAAIIKLGRHFTKLHRVLTRLDLLRNAVYVERASLPEQRIAPLAEIDSATVPYFATVLVRRDAP